MSLPATTQLTIVQGQTLIASVRRVTGAQTLDLASPAAGTYQIQVTGPQGTKTAAIAYNANAAAVQTAIEAIPSVGGGATVTGSGTSGSPFVITLTNASTQKLVVTPNFTPQVAPLVDWQNFDWGSWTALFTIAEQMNDGTYASPILTLTDASSGSGQIIFGYVAPAVEGGSPGTPVPANGVVAITITHTATAAFTAAQFSGKTIKYALFVKKSTYWKPLEDGDVKLTTEPQ